MPRSFSPHSPEAPRAPDSIEADCGTVPNHKLFKAFPEDPAMLLSALCLLSLGADVQSGAPINEPTITHTTADTTPTLLERMEWMGFIPLASGLPSRQVRLDIGENEFMTIGADGAFALHVGGSTAPLMTGLLLPTSHDDQHFTAVIAPHRGPTIRTELTPWPGSPTGIIVRTTDLSGTSPVTPPLIIDDFPGEETMGIGDLPISENVPIVTPPRRGRRYCVCLYELPDIHTTDYAVICSVFDCDNGKRCTPEPGIHGRCMWVRGTTDDVGNPWIAVLSVIVVAAAFCRLRQ